ncbi:MAG: oxygen-dependent tRNA uridine(34) hydroxylase TrhO [Gemmobacter sp.]
MVTVAAFYRFARLPAPAVLRAPLLDVARDAGVRGTILLATEGVNGTIAGDGVDSVLSAIRALPGFEGLTARLSTAPAMPFQRLKVRLRREIVTMGYPLPGPDTTQGTPVPPAQWNALTAAPDVAVIDTRNAFEVAMGSFAGAIDPGTASFGAFPAWWRANAARFAGKRIAMFCTGGIRCEKASAWLVAQGVPGVHQLQGGILRYLDEVPQADSLWRGDCFVFDERVTVGHGDPI